jgi:putative DNA primase/helicase
MEGSEGEPIDFNCAQKNVNEVKFQVQNLVAIPSHYRVPVVYNEKRARWESIDARGKMICKGALVDMLSGDVKSNLHMFIPNGAEWEYDGRAKAPKSWHKFLCDLFGEQAEEIGLLQEWFGYILSGDTWAQKGMLIVGPKRGGKGTIGHILTALLGDSMVVSPALHTLGAPFGLEPLLDRRMCLISDARLSNRADIMAVVEVLLRITAGDAVDVQRKHKSSVQARLDTRIMMLSNEMPLLADSSDAINSRFLILKLANSFFGREDHDLLPRLMTELPGIALWAIEGYKRLRERGRFIEPASSSDARADWHSENNPVQQFIEDRCTVEPGEKVSVGKLYEAYKKWAEGEGNIAISANAFSRRVNTTLMGRIERGKGDGGERIIRGISLKTEKF